MEKYEMELKYLEELDMTKERKIRLIESLYRLAHINFDCFLENNGEKIF